MDRIKAIGHEILGLFVEDARFSAALAIWIAISGGDPTLVAERAALQRDRAVRGLCPNPMRKRAAHRPTRLSCYGSAARNSIMNIVHKHYSHI